MKSKRIWLDGNPKLSDSFMRVNVDQNDGEIVIKIADCNRSIEWYFGPAGSKRAMKKIAKIKAFVDEAYKHVHDKKAIKLQAAEEINGRKRHRAYLARRRRAAKAAK